MLPYLADAFHYFDENNLKPTNQKIAEYLNDRGVLTRMKNNWTRKAVNDLCKRLNALPCVKDIIFDKAWGKFIVLFFVYVNIILH